MAGQDRAKIELQLDVSPLRRMLEEEKVRIEGLMREAIEKQVITYTSDNTNRIPPIVSGDYVLSVDPKPGRQFIFVQGRDGRPQAIPVDYASEPEPPKERRPSVAETMNDPAFIRACKLAGLEPSRRQAAKFRRQQGQAFKTTLEGQMARVDEIPEKRAPRAADDEEV